jgi:xanthine dehydrogenase accessory factor
MKNIYTKIPGLLSISHGLVLATVTENNGSTPQKPGSSALFNETGLITGTVGGGIVEGRVTEYARACSRTKKSGFLHFSLNKDVSMKEEAICGGEISILVDAALSDHMPVFQEMVKSFFEKSPGILITKITETGNDEIRIERHWMTKNSTPDISGKYLEKIMVEANEVLSGLNPDDFRHVQIPDSENQSSPIFFLEPVIPLPQLIIAGAGHIGKALSCLGKMLDFEVTVIDDRDEYANTDNLPDADHIMVADIGRAIMEIEKNADTYIVIVTRGHKDDAEALRSCIRSSIAYTGMIGSKTKVEKMHTEFIARGWATEEEWSLIHAPVGLDIKSKTVEEIAISIAAELVLVRNSRR